ncbi:MAG TPA: efflux RND transporter periplasmic adaptor subunit [Myxococcota bacterium]|jgi:Cu(I)/Ag(I) efflux system membrane fusion protein
MAEVEVPFERRQLTGVRVEPIEVRELTREIRTVGLVVADERRVRRIQTKISGWVEQLFVSFTGEAVRPGQPILSIYSPELVASQREYLLALEAFGGTGDSGRFDERDRRRLLDSARTRLRLWDVEASHIEELERSRDPQRRMVLHSPIAGYVTFKAVQQGMYVTPEMELYTVADLDHVWIWADVNEDEIALVTLGQQARIEVASAPGERVGAISFLQPTVDAATRTLRVRFDVDNADDALKPGMYATVTLERPLGQILALPEEAVIDTGVRKVVFVEVSDGHFQPREVKLGRKGAAHYEVLGGLVAAEKVVVSAQFLLDSESRLRGVARPAHAAH